VEQDATKLAGEYLSDLVGNVEMKLRFIADNGTAKQQAAANKAVVALIAKLDGIQEKIAAE
jgi:hypothetical protein